MTIEIEEAIARIRDHQIVHKMYEPRAIYISEALDLAIEALERESKTGRWIRHDTGHSIYYDCSLCGCVAPSTEMADKILWKMANYCPDCGSKMKKEDEDEWKTEPIN